MKSCRANGGSWNDEIIEHSGYVHQLRRHQLMRSSTATGK